MFALSLKALLALASFLSLSSGAVLEYRPRSRLGTSAITSPKDTCATETPVLSCSTTTAANTCCTPTPGGLLVMTQFWGTYTNMEKSGQFLPKGNWTIHGLWPDNCDGTFESYCDFSRQYDVKPRPSKVNGQTVPKYSGPTVDTFIKAAGRDDLLAVMNKYWVSRGNPNPGFWAHEYSKHGTCFSTFDTTCYPSFQKYDDLVDFFDTTTKAWMKYPTYDWLAAANIVPSNSTTYDLSALEDALKSQTGALPYLGCNNGVLNEIWYYSHALGPVQSLNFQDIDTMEKSKCPATGIRYPERAPGSEK